MKSRVYLAIWMNLLVTLAGCHFFVPSTVAPSSLPTSTTAFPPIATIKSTMTPLSSATKAPTTIVATYTPWPVLSSDERERKILELILNNGECDLPCWWGIVPGNTTFVEARNFLRQFSPTSFLQEEAPHIQFANYLIPVSETISPAFSIDINLDIVNEVVKIVSIGSIESATNFSVQDILSEYGQPSEIWVHTYRSYLGGVPPVDVLLFYADQGILARYSSELSRINENEDRATICLDRSPSLTLWSPVDRINFEQAQEYARLDYQEYNKPLLPLDQATSLSFNEFYEHRTKERICITTTLSIWPEP